jgi:invasion protein IalB
MRKGFMAGGLAAVLIVGFAAYFYHHSRLKNDNEPVRSVSQTHKGPTLAVARQFGAWKLVCFKRHKLTPSEKAWLGLSRKNHADISSALLCSAKTHVTVPGNNGKWIDLVFHRTGKGQFRNIFLNLAPGFLQPGDYFGLRIDETMHRVKVILCGPPICAALPIRKPDELVQMKITAGEQLVSAEKASLVFSAEQTGSPTTVDIPLSGLKKAADEMRKLDPGQPEP